MKFFIGDKPFPIRHLIEGIIHFERVFVLLLSPRREENVIRNVCAYDYEGNLVWEIKPHPVIKTDAGVDVGKSRYAAIKKDNATGKLLVFGSTAKYLIVPDTGEILDLVENG